MVWENMKYFILESAVFREKKIHYSVIVNAASVTTMIGDKLQFFKPTDRINNEP